jgi:prepilin-type N-terminal cleavage/methylation domain-containing protein
MKTVKQSFTLVEILVVIVIIGILSSFIFFTINDSVEKASIAKSKMFSESIRNNLMLNLVSEWKLNGDANDSWGSNNGTCTNCPTYLTDAQCVSDGCAYFDGDDYIVIGDKTDLSFEDNDFTISLWIKPLDNANMGFLGKRGNPWEYSIHIKTYNLIFLAWNSVGSGVYFHDTNSFDYDWAYFTWTADGEDSFLYMNGLMISGPKDRSNTMSDTIAPFEIGRAGDGNGTWYMRGYLDDIQIYNTAISETAIKQNYLLGLNNLYAKGLITELEYNEKLSEL